MNLAGILQIITDRLTAAGVPNPRVDADWLVAHGLGWRRSEVVLQGHRELTALQQTTIEQLVQRRCRREPLQYILGTQAFYGREFRVTPDVLIPRPETEVLVERALAIAPKARRMLDLCTGSGCIAITLALERPAAQLTATDLSTAALTVARENAARHAVGTRIEWIAADLFPPTEEPFDLIISNPPYCPEGLWPTLQPEVRDYEPRTAVVSGDDGLALLRRIVQDAPQRLHPGGVLLLEIGDDQASTVVAWMRKTGRYVESAITPDLTGRARIVSGVIYG